MPHGQGKNDRLRTRQHGNGLTLPQLNAVDLLAAGKTDTQAAELLSLHRTTITKCRLYDPEFQAALNRRRAVIWGAAADRLRSLVLTALEVVEREMIGDYCPNRLQAALAVLKMAPVPDEVMATGPTEADEIVRRVVRERRERANTELDDLLDDMDELPPFDEHAKQVRRELEALAHSPADQQRIEG